MSKRENIISKSTIQYFIEGSELANIRFTMIASSMLDHQLSIILNTFFSKLRPVEDMQHLIDTEYTRISLRVRTLFILSLSSVNKMSLRNRPNYLKTLDMLVSIHHMICQKKKQDNRLQFTGLLYRSIFIENLQSSAIKITNILNKN